MKTADRYRDRDYQHLLPKVLKVMFPAAEDRRAVEEILSAYGKEPYHRERDRVRLGILKLAWDEPDKLGAYTQLACEDYRDLLCAAEYPYSSRRFDLNDAEPDKYRELREKESGEYAAWLEQILSFGNGG